MERPSKLRSNIAVLHDRAEAHQRELDRDTAFFSVADLARRWGCSKNTVRGIPKADLPYLNLGHGLSRELRRYPPAGVYAYEARRLSRAV